jgi:2-amino-4-hydroxy-6-hydroxymethyldihydropteridine diphosphokinase
MIAHINIGSNIGDSRSIIERAVAAIFQLSEGPTRRSSYVESEPWGFESPNMFLNIGVEIESTLPPLELFARLQAIEKSICADSHRNADGSYRDRLIDIDLIFYGDTHLTTPQLTLPHPHATERAFVLTPIRELHPSGPLPI